MRKIIEEIVLKRKNKKISYQDMIIELSEAFLKNNIEREIKINTITSNLYNLKIVWKENNQEYTYEDVLD